VDDIVLSCSYGRAESPPDQPFEIGIGERHERGECRPTLAGTAAQQARDLVCRAGDALRVNRGELLAFHQARAKDRLAIADLGDEVDIRDPGNRLGVRPTLKRDAHPLGVAGFGDEKNAGALVHRCMLTVFRRKGNE